MSGTIGKTVRRIVRSKTDNRCYYCGANASGNLGEMEHFIPKSKGGTCELSNLVLSCKPCNSQKADLTGDEYIQLRIKYHYAALAHLLNLRG